MVEEVGAEGVVLESDNAKTVGFLSLGLIFFAAFAFAPYGGRVVSGWWLALLWPVRIVAGFYVAMMVMRLFRPQRIEAMPAGMTYFDGFRAFQFAWDEIASIDYLKGSFLAKMPGMVIITPAVGLTTGKKFPALQGGWPISLSEVATILNDARTRWAPPR